MSHESPPIVLVTEGSDAAPLAWLKARARVIEAGVGDAAFAEAIAVARGMVVRTYTKVDDALLQRAPHLGVVGRGGVGLENIDVAACRRRGVAVVYTPDANTHAVGDFVFGYIAQLLRPWCLMRNAVHPPAEFKRIRDTVRGRQFDELTIGILGMGRVGRRVGKIAANGYDMRVIYHDLLDVSPEVSFPATAVTFEQLFAQADIVSIHVDGRKENRGLVGAAEIAQMRSGAILINTARGEVLDAAAVSSAIRDGRLGGAALDVFSPEPPVGDFPLLGFENVLLTPHLAARTFTAIENMSWVVRDVMAVLEGRAPRCPAP